MKTLLISSIIVAASLCSCEFNQYEASSSVAGNHVKETNLQLGGTQSTSRSDGSSKSNNYENTAKDVVNGVVAYGIAKVSAPSVLKGTKNPQAIPGADRGAALIKGTKDPNIIPLDPNIEAAAKAAATVPAPK